MDFTNIKPGAKLVVIHEDDVGMSHGANTRIFGAIGARDLHLRLCHAALPLVSRGDRRWRRLTRSLTLACISP